MVNMIPQNLSDFIKKKNAHYYVRDQCQKILLIVVLNIQEIKIFHLC